MRGQTCKISHEACQASAKGSHKRTKALRHPRTLEKDGFRALVARWDGGRVLIRSRNGTDMTAAFPEIADAARALPGSLGSILLDGELITREAGRLAFRRLGSRINARPSTVSVRATQARNPLAAVPGDDRPFDHPGVADRVGRGTGVRGDRLERAGSSIQAREQGLAAVKVRATTEALIGAVTGYIDHPQDLLLGRFDRSGHLRYVGRTIPLKSAAAAEIGAVLAPAAPGHPWAGHRFSAAWARARRFRRPFVEPTTVAEISVDDAKDRAIYRHLVKFVRIRAELHPTQAPKFEDGLDQA